MRRAEGGSLEALVARIDAQLPGLRAGRGDARPNLDDFGALGAVKQGAGVVLGIQREETYRPGDGVEGRRSSSSASIGTDRPAWWTCTSTRPRIPRLEDLLDPSP